MGADELPPSSQRRRGAAADLALYAAHIGDIGPRIGMRCDELNERNDVIDRSANDHQGGTAHGVNRGFGYKIAPRLGAKFCPILRSPRPGGDPLRRTEFSGGLSDGPSKESRSKDGDVS